MSERDPLAYVLCGGRGTRLYPLTRDRAKPAVPFGGTHRVIDFVLSNLYNSNIVRVCAVTQYETRSLHRHLERGWLPRFGFGEKSYIRVLPARLTDETGWYKGTADAVTQNMFFIQEESPSLVDIFSGDHVYLMDVSEMNNFHLEKGGACTISAIPVRREHAASKYGVLLVDDDGKVTDFQEKPDDPAPIPEREDFCLASMGIYAFEPEVLCEELERDKRKRTTSDRETIRNAPEEFSSHDFGYDVLPSILRSSGEIYVYDYSSNAVPGMRKEERNYWRDIGNLDQYYETHMELISESPPLNLRNPDWVVYTYEGHQSPTRVNGNPRMDRVVLSGGVTIKGGNIKESVLSPGVELEDSEVFNSILLGGETVGRGVKIQRTILDRGVRIPDGERIGLDPERDKERGFTVTENGITVVPRNYVFE
jgi:glucose-1-phosphate adenylyltransferase